MKLLVFLSTFSIAFSSQSLGNKDITLPSLKEEVLFQLIRYDLNRVVDAGDLLNSIGATPDVLDGLRLTFLDDVAKPSFKKCYTMLKLYHETGKQHLVYKMTKLIFTTFYNNVAFRKVVSMVEIDPYSLDIVAGVRNMTAAGFWHHIQCLINYESPIEAFNILLALYPHPVDLKFLETFGHTLGMKPGLDYELLFKKLNFPMTTKHFNLCLTECHKEQFVEGLLGHFENYDSTTLIIAILANFKLVAVDRILSKLNVVTQAAWNIACVRNLPDPVMEKIASKLERD